MGGKFDSADPRPSVIIVGAGAGGVATAARLAAAGCKVTVLEKNDFSGGRCSLIHRDGFVRSESYELES
jgi:phytoene desaturase (3,4-didehydrolycopene-forming)